MWLSPLGIFTESVTGIITIDFIDSTRSPFQIRSPCRCFRFVGRPGRGVRLSPSPKRRLNVVTRIDTDRPRVRGAVVISPHRRAVKPQSPCKKQDRQKRSDCLHCFSPPFCLDFLSPLYFPLIAVCSFGIAISVPSVPPQVLMQLTCWTIETIFLRGEDSSHGKGGTSEYFRIQPLSFRIRVPARLLRVASG